jgi:hypothetical protein
MLSPTDFIAEISLIEGMKGSLKKSIGNTIMTNNLEKKQILIKTVREQYKQIWKAEETFEGKLKNDYFKCIIKIMRARDQLHYQAIKAIIDGGLNIPDPLDLPKNNVFTGVLVSFMSVVCDDMSIIDNIIVLAKTLAGIPVD